MAITNHERVGKAMELLKAGLAPFVEREFKSSYQDRSRGTRLQRFLGDDRLNAKQADRRVGRGGAAQAHVGRLERRVPQDAGPAERSLVSELRDCPQQVGAPGAVLRATTPTARSTRWRGC